MIRSVRDLLAGQADLAGLPPEDLDLLAGCGRTVVVPDGELLGHEGAVADHCYVVRAGRVGLEAHVPGAGSVRFLTVGPGELVGWSWLIPPHRWTADARAEGEVHAVALDGACLRRHCAEDPALGERLALRMAQITADRLAVARLQLLDLYAGGRGGGPSAGERFVEPTGVGPTGIGSPGGSAHGRSLAPGSSDRVG